MRPFPFLWPRLRLVLALARRGCGQQWEKWRTGRGLARYRGRWCAAWMLALIVPTGAPAAALRLAVIGDSLSAEYDALPNIPGVEDPTAYAAVTVPGWESRCWAEVLAVLRQGVVDFGEQKPALPGWNDLRFTGYQNNFAIPGFEASQYEEIVSSSLWSNPQYFTFKLTLGDRLRSGADAAVVWLGANEFRAHYGSVYEGGDPAPLVQNLKSDLAKVLDFVRNQSASLRLVVVNLPDLGAAPSKQAAHPDPVKRERVSHATRLANQAIGELAAARGLPVADAYAATRRLIEGQTVWFGPVDIYPGSDPDNHPRWAFARDGLHPNTALQTEIARLIVAALNTHYGTSIPLLTDGEALGLLGISPQQPYFEWAAARGLSPSGMGDDPDRDGLVNLVECAFDLDPSRQSQSPVTISPSPSGVEVSYRPDARQARLVSVTPQSSPNLTHWTDVPAALVSTAADGRVTVRFPATGAAG